MPKKITKIQKRNGQIVKFEKSKITQAMYKAFCASKEIKDDKKRAQESSRLTPIAVGLFQKTINGETPTVETMQNVIEQVLMAADYYETAKTYILYRQRHSKRREVRNTLGIKDDLKLSINQLKVMESRYLRHDNSGRVSETPLELFTRVAKAVAKNEEKDKRKWQKQFLEIMTNFEFMPAGGYLRTAGTDRCMVANCFVLPIKDSMEDIFNSVKWMALVHQKGGGTGFNFSSLRPKGDIVNSSGGYSSGPISFMKVFDAATRQVMQGGYKRGANMGILNIDHPDILDFINCKSEENEINNFNISVGITDDFMQAVEDDTDWQLKNPRSREPVQTVPARNIFDQIVNLAWRTGDPGVIFLDAINKDNPVLKTLGPMVTTNPCGEQPLHPFDVCNLGSLNLSAFTSENYENKDNLNSKINWQRLAKVTSLAVRFQDNGIDISNYPIKKIAKMAQKNRRIGLGVMGWADLLYKLEIPYNSQEARDLSEKMMSFINTIAHKTSSQLGEEKGNFPNWKGSTYEDQGINQRNLAITTIAPTGTISMVADCSSGIEPVFLLSYTKNVVADSGLLYVNPYFEKALKRQIDDEQKVQSIISQVSKTGSCQHIEEVPENIKKVFVTAHDIFWKDHIKMQASFQKNIDNAVSKTINFPNSATISEIEKAYILAWKSGCKGVTIYRDGSKSFQILESNDKKAKNVDVQKQPIIQSKIKVKSLEQRIKEDGLKSQKELVSSISADKLNSNGKSSSQKQKKEKILNTEYSISDTELCPECSAPLQMSEGCCLCLSCGFSKCSL